MSISYQSFIIADFRYVGISGAVGIGCYRLRFSFEYTTPAHEKDIYIFKNARAYVYASRAGKQAQFLGFAQPENALIVRVTKYSGKSTVMFEIDLDNYQMHAIEEIRQGQDLSFRLTIFGEVYGPGDPYSAIEDVNALVNQKEWARVLGEMEFADILLFEFVLPTQEGNEHLKEPIAQLVKARQQFIDGNYDLVISICRLALDSLTKVMKDKEKLAESIKLYRAKDQNPMTKEQRELLIREAVKVYTQLSHHVGDAGVVTEYGRNDANFILASTAAVISRALSRGRT